MGTTKAELLRFHEVRNAYRLIGECRDLGSDPALWQTRLMEGIGQLLGVRATCGGEGLYVGPIPRIAVVSSVITGLDDDEHAIFYRWASEITPDGCPIFCAMKKHRARALTRKRTELITDREWYRSSSFLFRAHAPFDHQLTSIAQVDGGPGFSGLCAHKERGHRDFTAREQQLMHFLHCEIVPLVGRALVSSAERGPAGLSRRLRQTLVCLLEGDSEKQVAARLQLSRATTHQYVTALYRHFAVRSRAQLLALALRRFSRAPWRELLRDVGSPVN